ncbi:MAG: HIT family protein [Thermoflavifilum aggregans]|nr:HIT family protein [Thermoflavifilum aggregans]
MMTIFSRIIKGEIPCYKIAENDLFFAFLDIHPLVKGHTLVIPKREVDYFLDMNDEELSQILLFAKPIARAIRQVVPCERIGMSVVGLEVPHAHLHLVPIRTIDDLNFTRPKLQLSDEEMKQIQQQIIAHLSF